MRTWLAYTDLARGDRFRFVYGPLPHDGRSRVSAEVYTKTSHGWFEDSKGKKFRTGKLSAVRKEAQ